MISRPSRRRRPAIAIASVVFMCSLLITSFATLYIGQRSTESASRQATRINCTGSPAASARLLFQIMTTQGAPVGNATVTVDGTSVVTNSSGLAVFPHTSATKFSLTIGSSVIVEALNGNTSPALCLGSAYYQIVSMVEDPSGSSNS